MNWLFLTESKQLENIIQASYNQAIIIYKHSTRCGVSRMVKKHLESDWSLEMGELKSYCLDLLAYRPLSNAIAEKFNIQHKSPQILLIRNGKCIYTASHSEIDAIEMSNQVNLL